MCVHTHIYIYIYITLQVPQPLKKILYNYPNTFEPNLVLGSFTNINGPIPLNWNTTHTPDSHLSENELLTYHQCL